MFNRRIARSELRDYRRNGPRGTTKRLVEALKSRGVAGLSLLDVGGGVGVIQHELKQAGVSAVTGVDASSAYLQMAEAEAERRGYRDATYLHGDFVALADQVEAADIVTMDRVICCYPDAEALMNTAAAKTRQLLGLIFPRDTWWVKLAFHFVDLYPRLTGNPFRSYIHPTATVERIAAANALRKVAHQNSLFWQVVVYVR